MSVEARSIEYQVRKYLPRTENTTTNGSFHFHKTSSKLQFIDYAIKVKVGHYQSL